jgi:hypothetical protein
MKMLQGVLALVAVLTTPFALAARPNYTSVGLGYSYEHLDGGCGQDGPFVEASMVLNELYYLHLNHTDLDSDAQCGSISSALGVGIYGDIGASSSLYASLSGVRRDLGQDADLGVGVDLGLRSILNSGIEVLGLVGYEHIDRVETSYFGLGVNYWLSQSFSLSGSVKINDVHDEGLSIGLRYNF